MQVNYNISAMIANNALSTNDNKLSESIERLSSGLKIANAKDNPSGLAISRRMHAQIKSLNVAGDNSSDGISVIQTADGTLNEVHDILQRMSELSIQAANGTNSGDDREIIQDEITQLKDEISRISEATQFNGQNLLDGSFDLRGYSTVKGVTDSDITVNSYSESVLGGDYLIEGLYTRYNEKTGKVMLYGTAADRDNGVNALDQMQIDVTRLDTYQGVTTESTYMSNANVTVDGDLIRITSADGRSIEIKTTRNLNGEPIDLELTGKGAMTMQIGANEGQTLDIIMPKVTLSNLGIYYADVTRTIDDDITDNLNSITTNDIYTLPNEALAQQEWNKILDVRNGLYDFAQKAKYEIETGSYEHIEKDIVRQIEAVRFDDKLDESEKKDKIEAIWEERYMKYVNHITEIENMQDGVGHPETALNKLTAFGKDFYITEKWQNEINNTLYSASMGEINSWEAGIKFDGIFSGSIEKGMKAPNTGADQAIEDIGNAIQRVSDIRSRLGAYQNRLEHTVSNINVTSENMTAAYSRIMDVDMAEEMTLYSTQQVLSQAGTSMLAQANERPSQVLQLLQ